jgi:hypothetical protein
MTTKSSPSLTKIQKHGNISASIEGNFLLDSLNIIAIFIDPFNRMLSNNRLTTRKNKKILLYKINKLKIFFNSRHDIGPS